MLGWLASATAPVCAQQAAQPLPNAQQSALTQASQSTTAVLAAEQSQLAPATKPTTLVETRLTLGQTLTTNVGLRSGSEGEAISRITPGVYISSRSGRVQGFLDYSLSGVAYARSSNSNELLNQLRSSGTAELLERHAYMDAQASITQQAVNPLGVDSVDDQVGRGNRTEVRTLQLTPRFEGRLGDIAQWDARVSHRATHSVSNLTSDSSSTQWQLQAGNAQQQLSTLGWMTQLSRNVQDFSNGRRTVNDVARGVLDWRFNSEFFTGAIAGYESSNVASDDKQGRATYGLRLNWIPSERTKLFAETEKRFFGNSHNFNFSHRMVRTVVSYSDTRTLSYGLGQPLAVGRGTAYDFFDQLYASREPDATVREAKVLQVLRDNGIESTAGTNVLPAFLSSAVTLQRLQQFSFAWTGTRDTLTVSMQQSTGRRVDSRDVFGDPFTVNRDIRQRGFSVLLAHRLTPLSTLTLGLTQRRNIGDLDSTRLLSTTVQWSTSLGPRTKLSLLGRHSSFKSSSQPYTESALVGTLGMTF
jgi:uncharacterized protein (PEP-CTERM system associated)